MAELILLLIEENTETLFSVTKDVFSIGRLPECDLSLPFGGISRNHAKIMKVDDGMWVIEDLGSKNGTKVNQNFINYPQQLYHGDIIWLGNISLVVQFTATKIQPRTLPSKEQNTIFHSVKQLQQQWIDASSISDNEINKDTTIARLKDLVDIAKNLSGAASIEEIFSQVQEVVFRYLNSIDRLALLIEVNGSGNLQLINSATRNITQRTSILNDANWISQSICQKVYQEKIAIQSPDTYQDQRFAEEHSIVFKGIRSAMAVPLWDEDKVVGVLYADALISSTHWQIQGEEELSFFSALANLVASSVQRWLLVDKLKMEVLIRHRLERYLSPSVVQQLISVGGLANGRLLPTESEISILFADLVGFTELSEKLTPNEIAELLNSLFEEMLQEVFAYGGTLDKYIGDCIMAFFGAPEPQADHADRCVAAARGMLARLDSLNRKNFWPHPLQLRIAINSGRAVVGDVGSSQRLDYTALGATINLAARMEAICPPRECIISEVTYTMLSQNSNFEVMGNYRFKGIERSIKVYKIKLD
ncbi:adenylate/guanylate cyclase domain-containing protein [Cronbergia sp. UHCC 0137]|uniref:adenylate/guanylate cyclase domain-containing protein n=1 Tax=Cronbergia sp. UHCC 0137 TaxID=3110239 RepID=UPI002B1EC107|nr:adenylate/guanylate cyclase domain-containing protein [Cronbergia sp. UHCC 0137]MEA5619209.1 adenylate/guanylate cyclase domain-containing protein [Cronbergia sp. UHCC 0137]